MKMKVLHKGICEQEILIALVMEESGEASAVRGKLYLGFGGFSFKLWLNEPLNNLLIIFWKNSEIFSNFKIKVNQTQ